jgi:hypothetical protein
MHGTRSLYDVFIKFLNYCDLLFCLYPSSLCFPTTTFRGMALASSSGGLPIEASSIDRTQQSRFHLMTREEPSLETLWLQNIGTMDKVHITDRSNTASSSKTFRDEVPKCLQFSGHIELFTS